MKARDYAERYAANPTGDTLNDILTAFFEEAAALSESRGATTYAGQYAVLNEQNQKWQAFGRLVAGVKEDGFKMIIKEMALEVYEGWQKYQERCNRR